MSMQFMYSHFHVISPQVTSVHAILCRSFHVISLACHITSCHSVSPHFRSAYFHVTSIHVFSPQVTLCRSIHVNTRKSGRSGAHLMARLQGGGAATQHCERRTDEDIFPDPLKLQFPGLWVVESRWSTNEGREFGARHRLHAR